MKCLENESQCYLNYGRLSINRGNLWARYWSILKTKLVKTDWLHDKVWRHFNAYKVLICR